MKLKTVEINGKQYAEIDTAGLPVYVHDDGKEIGFDAPLATKKITELNGEAKNHRLAKEAAEEKLAKFDLHLSGDISTPIDDDDETDDIMEGL